MNKVLGAEVPTGSVSINTGGALTSGGGKITLNAEGKAIALADLAFLDSFDLSAVDFLKLNFGNVFINGTGYIDAEGGDVDINNTGILKAAADSIRTSGTGTINLEQNSGIGFAGLSVSLMDMIALGSIQNAVYALNNTGTGLNTIEVGAGVFVEDVTVDHDNVALRGAKADIGVFDPARGLSLPTDLSSIDVAGVVAALGNESIVGSLGGNAFTITGKNVDLNGFVVAGAATGVTVTGADAKVQNNIIGLGQDGVRVVGADNTEINGNLIAGLTGTGIELLGATKANVHDVVAIAGGHGISAFGGGNLTVEDNIIAGVAQDGVHVAGVDTSKVAGNTIVAAMNNGIYVGADKVAGSKNATVYDNDVLVALNGGERQARRCRYGQC